jgi:hypothetical protein
MHNLTKLWIISLPAFTDLSLYVHKNTYELICFFYSSKGTRKNFVKHIWKFLKNKATAHVGTGFRFREFEPRTTGRNSVGILEVLLSAKPIKDFRAFPVLEQILS